MRRPLRRAMGLLDALGRYFQAHPDTLTKAVDALERWATLESERPEASAGVREPSGGVRKPVRTVRKPSFGGRPEAVVPLERARRLLSEGLSLGKTAKKLGLPKSTLWDALQGKG